MNLGARLSSKGSPCTQQCLGRSRLKHCDTSLAFVVHSPVWSLVLVLQPHNENQPPKVPHCMVQVFMVMENLLLGECRSVLGKISPPFMIIQNLLSAVEETIDKEILQAPSAYITLVCCVPLLWLWLLKLCISGNPDSIVSACCCCMAVYAPWLLLRFKNLVCVVPESALDYDDVKDFSAVCKIAHSYKCIWIVSMGTGHSACSILGNMICICE